MSRKLRLRLLAVLAAIAGAAALPLAGLDLASAAPVSTTAQSPTAPAPAATAQVLTYDPNGAPEFADAIVQGADAWNSRVRNVRLERVTGDQSPDITFFSDDQWPFADPANRRIDMGKQAVREGHYPPRIASHELGHILGLPDNRTGRCEDLMSGHSAGTECKNIYPSPAEAAQVDASFGQGQGRTPAPAAYVFHDGP